MNQIQTRLIVSLIISALLLVSVASATGIEAPPELSLNDGGVIETLVKANYSWEYPTGNQDEWSGVEACGMAPTDPVVWETFDHVLLTGNREYTLEWNGNPPDELIFFRGTPQSSPIRTRLMYFSRILRLSSTLRMGKSL